MVNEELVLKYISEEKELLSELRLTYTEGQIKMIIENLSILRKKMRRLEREIENDAHITGV